MGASASPAVTSMNITDVACYGATDGGVVINTTGGTPPIKYSIDAGVTFSNSKYFYFASFRKLQCCGER